MKKWIVWAVLAFSWNVQAQLFTVQSAAGDVVVMPEEFAHVFNKNKDIGKQIDPKTPQEYLDLYIAFKRKVAQAQELGSDKNPVFINEYESYYRQLVKPYLTDKNADERVLTEAYARMQEDVYAAHIMIDLSEDALPTDTMRVYNEMIKLRQRLVTGEDFAAMAEKFSSDTYSAQRKGELGWFTVFQMVYPFESAAYNTPIGSISMPVRSQYGYHLVKTLDRRPARYKIEVAHILITETPGEEASDEARIQEIYAKLKAGESFGALARAYSQDKNSARNDGRLTVFGMNDMLPEFESKAFDLSEDGAFSAPFKTKIGWHVVQRLRRVAVPALVDIRSELESKIRRDSRSNTSRASFVKSLKNSYQTETNNKSLRKVLAAVDDSFLQGKWDSSLALAKLKKPLLTYTLPSGEKVVKSQGDFLAFLNKAQEKPKTGHQVQGVVYEMYNAWVDEQILSSEEKLLPAKYPAFRYLAQEYREGILVFELTRESVWDKSSKDTSGLKTFFANHATQYQWNERRSGQIFTCADESTAGKLVRLLRKGTSASKAVSLLTTQSALAVVPSVVSAERGASTVSKEQEALLAASGLGSSLMSPKEVLLVESIIKPQPKALKEVRGLAISDYQKFLEGEWLKTLEAKYPVVVNAELWQTLESELSK